MCGIKASAEQKQKLEEMMLEWLELCRKKELYRVHDSIKDSIGRAMNTMLLSINLKSQRLDMEKQEVKNNVEQATKQPEYSLSMRDEHLSTIPETESDEVIKSSVKNLVLIPSESEVTFDNNSECDVPVNDESFPIFTTFSNPLFDCNDNFTSSDDNKIDPHHFNESDLIESLLNRDILIDSSPKFDYLLEELFGELAHIDPILPRIEEADFDLEEEIRLVENLLYDNSSPRPPEELNAKIADMIVESLSTSYPHYDSEGDIHFLEELLNNDPLPLPENESSNFDHHDDSSFPRPPLKPPNVKVFFDFEPDTVLSPYIAVPTYKLVLLSSSAILAYLEKELYRMHDSIEDLIGRAMNTMLLSINLKSQSLDIEMQEVKNIVEQATKLIKSSVKNLFPIPSEFEVTSDNDSECDVPVNDESSPIFTTFTNPLFDCNDNFTSSDDKLLSNDKIDPHHFNESDLIESLLNRDILIDSSPKFDYILEEFSGELAHIDTIPPGIEEADFDLEEEIHLVENLLYDNSSLQQLKELNAEITDTIVESLSPPPILVEDSDSHMKEIDLFLAMDDLMPSGIENNDYDSERDIHFLEELLNNDLLPLPENESSNFDHYDDPSFPRPPPKPSDVKVFFDFEPDTGVLTTKVVNGIFEHYVLMPNILPTLPTIDPDLDFTPSHDSLGSGNKIFDLRIFIEVQSERLLSREKFSISFIRDPFYPVFDTLLPFSSENEEKMFKPGDILRLDVLIAPDLEASRARGFVHHPLELQSLAYGNLIS
nr:hypothetical protein [Tanacetum cinerariifolium]